MHTNSPAPLASSPANPATLERAIGPLTFELSADGMVIRGLPAGPLALTVEETLALSDFLRSPGVRSLVSRAWLAEQFATVALADAPAPADDERRQRRHAGRAA